MPSGAVQIDLFSAQKSNCPSPSSKPFRNRVRIAIDVNSPPRCFNNVRFGVTIASELRSAVIVSPPPPSYDFRAESKAFSRSQIESTCPELLDLVDSGTLVVVPKATDYEERRSDGYREPELVYLVGTAHVSRKSAADVARVIAAVKPQNVVVELCRSRAGAMYDVPGEANGVGSTTNLLALGGDSFGSAVRRALQLGGRSALALRLLLGRLSRQVEASAGVQSGEEFRAARIAAEAVGAQVVLGDRPIEITLKRAWQALPLLQKVELTMTLLRGASLDASEETLQALQSDDALSAMYAAMGERFPALMGPLIHERDMYLAWSLKRSKAVNGCVAVVGVLGKGHLRGVVYALKHNQEGLRFKDLVGERGGSGGGKSGVAKFVRNLVVETAVGGVLWLLWQQWFGDK